MGSHFLAKPLTQLYPVDDDNFVDCGFTLIRPGSSLDLGLDTSYFLLNLHANSMETNTGAKPKVIQPIDSNISMRINIRL
jgi:hypothetical protein